jgi:hypothetical protein
MVNEQPGSIWALDSVKPYAERWQARQQILAYRRAYYDGTIYKNVRDRFQALGQLQASLGPRLYRGTKALFLNCSRAVDVDAGIIPGGWALAEDAPSGWQPAIDQVFAWSDWATDGVLFVHFGALYGITGLKVCDLRDQQRVAIKPIDPSTFMLVRTGQYDKTPKLAIIVEQRSDEQGEYEYAEIITPNEVQTYRNGSPSGYDDRPPAYPNDMGFVPLIERCHLLTGDELGECTYQKAIPILDEVNELASYLADIVKKHAEAQWVIIGAEPSDLVKSGDNIWFVPQGGDAKPLVAGIDIAGVLAFIQEIAKNAHDALPELAFEELKSKTQIATATLEIQLMELVIKIKRTRPNYDHGLADALRMAGKAGVSMGVSELGILDDEALGFDPERPVIPLDKLSQIQLEMSQTALDQQQAIANGEQPAGMGAMDVNNGKPGTNVPPGAGPPRQPNRGPGASNLAGNQA